MKNSFNAEDIKRKVLLILSENSEPAGARLIARKMKEYGVHFRERTVRYRRKLMDEGGFTRPIGRRDGRSITDTGMDEINNARVKDKISLSISRIDILSFKTTFDIEQRCGLVPGKISFFPQKQFNKAMSSVMEYGNLQRVEDL
jgi:hypothetical protein